MRKLEFQFPELTNGFDPNPDTKAPVLLCPDIVCPNILKFKTDFVGRYCIYKQIFFYNCQGQACNQTEIKPK